MEKERQQQHLIDTALQLLNEQYEKSAEFNAYFDAGEQLKLGKLKLDKSRVLFWLDPEGYAAEKAEWENQTIQERNEEAIELLKDNGQTSPFREIVEAVKRQRIVAFVGSGFSKSMDMPLWREALQELHDKRLNLNSPEFALFLAKGLYLEAAQILADHNFTITNNYIRTRFNVHKVAGPVELLPYICSGCIVTTNFDAAIEEVFRLAEKPFDGYMHGTQHHNFFSRLVKGSRCILKLHGDAGDDPGTFVFTRQQYMGAYGEPFDFKKPLPKALRQIFISNSLLFLGCSLDQDWTLELFKKVISQGEYEIPNHFAILEEPKTREARHSKESKLLEHCIQPIWYPAEKHEYIEKLLRFMIDIMEKRMTYRG